MSKLPPPEDKVLPADIDDAEVLRREAAMDSGEEQVLSKEEFLEQVGRGLP